jgi:hypothetical protein
MCSDFIQQHPEEATHLYVFGCITMQTLQSNSDIVRSHFLVEVLIDVPRYGINKQKHCWFIFIHFA